jgi:hypothetical protein
MWNEPTKEQLAKFYETEKVPLEDKPIYLHCFIGDCDWFISEYDDWRRSERIHCFRRLRTSEYRLAISREDILF